MMKSEEELGSSRSPRPPDEHPSPARQSKSIALWLSRVLRLGVALSFSLLLLGIIVDFVRHPDYLEAPRVLEGILRKAAEAPSTQLDIEGVMTSFGQGVTTAGLIILILTPVFRVLTSLILFHLSKDRFYVVLTAMVLVLMMSAALVGEIAG